MFPMRAQVPGGDDPPRDTGLCGRLSLILRWPVLCGPQDPGPGGPLQGRRASADILVLRPHLGTSTRTAFSQENVAS